MRRGRFVRSFAATLAGSAVLSGLALVVGVNPAAAGPASGGSSGVAAASQPNILANANNQPVADWTVTLAAGSTWTGAAPNPDYITIPVLDNAGHPTIAINALPTVTPSSAGTTVTRGLASTDGKHNNELVITFTSSQSTPTTSAQTITVSGLAYNVDKGAATGVVAVTPTFDGVTTNFTTGNASNATVGNVAGTVVATSQPVVHAPSSASTVPVGGWTITLAAGSTWSSGDTITLTVEDSGKSTTNVTFGNPAPSVTALPAGNGTGQPTVAGAIGVGANANTFTITLTGSPTAPITNPQPISVTNVNYTLQPTTATGAVIVTDTYTGGVVLDSTNASNAAIAVAPLSALTAASTPTVAIGGSGQPAGNFVLGIYTKGDGWQAGDTYVIAVGDKNRTNCVSSDTVGFASTPSASVTTGAGQTAVPTVSVALGTSSLCATTSIKDEVIVTFTNSGLIGGSSVAPPYPVTITLSGVAYNLGTGVPIGNLAVASKYNGQTSAPAGSTTGAPTGPSDAQANAVFASANNPPVAAAPSAQQPISPVALTEGIAGAVPTGFVCLTLSAGTWDKSVAPAASSGGGSALANTFSGAGSATLSFDVTTASTSPTTYTFSQLLVDAPSTAQMVTLTVQDGGSAAGCATSTTVATGLRAYATIASTRVQGTDADGTAVAEMEAQFVPGTNCPGSKSVVLATDTNYPDALAASYLAGYLGTGILLTPTNSLSASTAAAIQAEGIQQVYIVGGPVAVSNAVQTQLQATQAYNCGGTTGMTSNGAPVDLQVARIAGDTLYDTAEQIALDVGANFVGTAAFPNAYGLYDDVHGLESTSAGTGSTAVPTAILATGSGFQDAIAASPIAFAQGFPVLLTDPSTLSPQALQGLQTLGIQQVIVMGGPVAVSDGVVTTLLNNGFEVLRVAGNDATDTAQELAQFELNGGSAGLGWASAGTFKNTILVSRGDFYSDGLAGCVIAGSNKQPILLTENPSTVGQYLTAFANAVGAPGSQIPVLTVNPLGGVQAVTPATLLGIMQAISAG